MVLFNYSTKEITAKIVYYGPGLCGKTTNLQFVYDALPSNNKSKMLSLATKADRTLFFDFLPLDLGKIRGMRTRMQLYTVPGQVYYNSTRQLVLKGADGVVFVADSQDDLVDANLESWNNLKENLRRQGVDFRKLPVVIQFNKRDLPNVLPVDELDKRLNELNAPCFESVATSGIGVEDTLRGIVRLVLKDLMGRYGLSGDVSDDEISIAGRRPAGAKPASEGESPWAEDPSAAVESEDDGQDVPFLLSEAPGHAPRQPEMDVEVLELGAGAAGFVDGAVEILPETSSMATVADDDDIIFDTVPDSQAGPPRPLAADSLVVALGGAAERRPPQTGHPAPIPPASSPTAPGADGPSAPAPAVVAKPVPPAGAADPAPFLKVEPDESPFDAPVPPAPLPKPLVAAPSPPPSPRPSLTVAPADPSVLVREVTLPLNLSVDELAGKKKIVLRLQLEINILR